ncbi:hypothetical protein KC845_03370 [Candidatus Kaiserbacteria bacterium]|nr:hypothetical protein [Candidatus Kaiserbacteria bacterium]
MNKITNILKSLKTSNQGGVTHVDKRLTHPRRDWLLGMFFFTLILASGCVLGGVLFAKHNDININSSDIELNLPRYNERNVEAALTKFVDRKHQYQNILSKAVPQPVESVSTSTELETTTESDDQVGESGESLGLDNTIDVNAGEAGLLLVE